MTAALKRLEPQSRRQPIMFPRPIPKAARAKIEAAVEAHLAAIEALTACLDAAEPDPDLEPSLGICPNGPSDDRERDVADEPHDEANEGNSEPSLGAPERNFAGAYRGSFSQEGWGAGAGDDRENDGDDLEPDVDDEPKHLPAVME